MENKGVWKSPGLSQRIQSYCLLDEPTAGMNPRESESVMELISNIVNKIDVTILLIEHNMNVVMGISDRIAVLDHGSQNR